MPKSLVALVGTAAALLVGTGGPQAARGNSLAVRSGNTQQTVTQTERSGGLLGALFGRRSTTRVTTTGGAAATAAVSSSGQRRLVVHNNVVPGHVVSEQLLVDRRSRGLLNQLNTFSFANHSAANVRFVPDNVVYYYAAPATVRTEVIERRYVAPAADVTQQEDRSASCPDGCCSDQVREKGSNYQEFRSVIERVTVQERPQAVIRQQRQVNYRSDRGCRGLGQADCPSCH
jgi:hypothetical protein